MSFLRVRLGIPHKPDGGERDRSLADLLKALEPLPRNVTLRVFDEKKPNRAWARDLWGWGSAEDVEFFLTLQDDVRVMPKFWPVLYSMLTYLPHGAVLGIGAQDARIAPAMRPWVRSRAWVMGWAYGMWREDAQALRDYDLSGEGAQWTEDTFVNEWCKKTGRDVWHPVPTPAQHRTELQSTYSNWPRPAACDWTRVSESEQARMATPAYWAATAPPYLKGMVNTVDPGPTLVHPNIMGSPNYGGSPPVPWNR